ncbi:hypothetical protein BMS3Abin11_02276 [bacterium BMS3Abin11]|nr:hypothetical protein BMS3Abin11_02276 [bacterium BMS3Abin11]
MSAWEKIGEDASIVLVGSFNPSIFHPEWFIRHEILADWNYPGRRSSSDKPSVATMPDLAQVEFQNQRNLQVMLNKFTLGCARASEYLSLKDIAISTFGILQETPITQMGMNYTAVIQIADKDLWIKFGELMAPKEPWVAAAPYINDLDKEKQDALGLLEMTMQMPRPDDLKGFIRPTLKALDLVSRTLSISINNHVVIEDNSAATMIDYLNGHWEIALDFADDFIKKALSSQLEEGGLG